MDWDTFYEIFSTLVPQTKSHLSSAVLARIFDFFDTDDDGIIDYAEFAAGLQLLCGRPGDRDEKIKRKCSCIILFE